MSGDLCDACHDNLVVENDDYCRSCLTEIEADIYELERQGKVILDRDPGDEDDGPLSEGPTGIAAFYSARYR